MEQQQTQRQELEVLLRQHVEKAHVEVLSSQQRGFECLPPSQFNDSISAQF